MIIPEKDYFKNEWGFVMNEEKSITNRLEETAYLHIRRVPLNYKHPKENEGNFANGQYSFVPLLDGCEYYNVSAEHEKERERIVNRTGEQWESLEEAFFGARKFRDYIVADGESIIPLNPEALNEIVLKNLDAYGRELLNPNFYTPIPLNDPDEDKFGFALYRGALGVPMSPIFASVKELHEFLSNYGAYDGTKFDSAQLLLLISETDGITMDSKIK